MTRKARELETLFLAMFAAVPLYLTFAIGKLPLLLFHGAMAGMALRVALGKSPEVLPARLMRGMAMAYIPFYIFDWLALSHSAIAASTHLVLFIAVYQPIEAMKRENQAQRILTAALIFVASIATSTHITIILFVLAFAFLIFRQLMSISHLETARALEREYAEAPSARAALFYVSGALLIGAALFPFLPRVRNPFVQGVTGSLPGATTALSETIDFREPRVSPLDSTIIARIWIDYSRRPFFIPIRLRGNIYDDYRDGEWRQRPRGIRPLQLRDDGFFIGRRDGIDGTATVQMKAEGGKLYLPVGTYNIDGLTSLYEGPARDTYYTYNRGLLTLDVRMAQRSEPLRLTHVSPLAYPVTPEVAKLAREVVGGETDPERQAHLIEAWMLRNFRYVPNPSTPPAMSLERFLLRDRIGHCEYFAAGMAVMLTALEVPARIAGGYHGGRFNPLMGYFTVRRDDAHAWTEVWNGTRWLTFDATPPSLRPGTEDGSMMRAYASALSDSINYFWDRYILTFGLTDQITFFTDVIDWTRERVASLGDGARVLRDRRFLMLLSALLAAGLAAILWSRRRKTLFDLIAARLAARGVEIAPTATVEEALAELRVRDPQFATAIAPVLALYEEETFSGRRDPTRRRTLRRMLGELSNPAT